MANAATGRPVYGDRFNTRNQESALLARGFRYGTAPGALMIGWNSGHTAVTLPDGTPVSSGEGGGVKVGGGGAFQSQFTHHMYLPAENIDGLDAAPPIDPFAPPPPPAGEFGFTSEDPNALPQTPPADLPAPGPELPPAPELGAPPQAPTDPFAPPPPPGDPLATPPAPGQFV